MVTKLSEQQSIDFKGCIIKSSGSNSQIVNKDYEFYKDEVPNQTEVKYTANRLRADMIKNILNNGILELTFKKTK